VTSPNLPNYHLAQSCLCLRISSYISFQNVASAGCSTHTVRLIAVLGPEYHRRSDHFIACGPQVRIRCKARI
jgi:hypothetical protein